MERPGGASSVMRYDGVGQRIWKGAGNGTGEHSVLDGAETVAVTDGAGTVQHWNLLAGGVIGRVAGTARRYYVRDHLGSVRQQVDAAGAVLSYGEDYYPFGLQMPGRSMVSDAPKERFTGHELDEETGLYYAGARYLDPVIGRWTSVDPLASKYPDLSPYNYVANNPLLYVDPDGRKIVLGTRFERFMAWFGFKNENIKRLETTATILRSTKEGAKLWNELDKRSEIIEVWLTQGLRDKRSGVMLGGTMDPTIDEQEKKVTGVVIRLDNDQSAMDVDNVNAGLNPEEAGAVTLSHELVHAKEAFDDVDKYRADKETEDVPDAAEERVRQEIVEQKNKENQ